MIKAQRRKGILHKEMRRGPRVGGNHEGRRCRGGVGESRDILMEGGRYTMYRKRKGVKNA